MQDQDITDLNAEIIEALAHAFGILGMNQVHESAEDGAPIISLLNGRRFKVALKEI